MNANDTIAYFAEHLEVHVSRPGLSDEERADGADELLAVIRRYSK